MQFLHGSIEDVSIVHLQQNVKLGPTETKEQQLTPEAKSMSKQMTLSAPIAHEPAFLRSILERVAEKWAQNKVYRETLNELRALSDRDLSDLGLSRANIRYVAREAALKA